MNKELAPRKFEDLKTWRDARDLVNRIYNVTNTGEFAGDYALRNQIRRSAISIASNIAEGFDRFNPREFRHFLSISKASCAELRAQLYLAYDQNYLDEDRLDSLKGQSERIGRQLSNFMKYLKKLSQ